MVATSPRPPQLGERSRRDLAAPWRHVDMVLVLAALCVAVLGVTMVYSATKGHIGPPNRSFLMRQGSFMVLGVVLMAAMSLIDYRRLKQYAVPIYAAMVLLLTLVVSPLGSEAKGAQAWFAVGSFKFEPSEISKLALVIALATVLSNWVDELDLRRLGVLLGIAGVPLTLVMLQPDLGTALVFVALTVAMLSVGGVKGRHLAVLTLVGVIGVVGVLKSDVLAEYQKARLTTFLDPSQNQAGTAFNLNQSMITITRGGLTGDGLFKGRQTQLNYVPEQQTDFIFTAVAEELGFIGAAVLLILYSVIIWRIWRTAKLSRDRFGSLLCVGILAILTFHIFENIGMTMGIMPVTGIPLPLMSYGGSSTVATFLGLGIVLNVHMHRFR
jgi:rod shape determining protein RodA